MVFDGKTTIDQPDADKLVEAYGVLEAFLQGQKWVAGDFLSVADYSLATSAGSIAVLVPIDAKKFPALTAWLKRVEELPEFQANIAGQKDFETMFKTKLGLI